MEYGASTLAMVESAWADGVDHAVLLMRHSAREFEPGRHDLLNPLTDAGRALARELGARLPKQLLARAYASPAERCVETAELVLAGHAGGGGRTTRQRPIEALGVFYVLDQMRMYRAMTDASGQTPFLARWFAGAIPEDVMMPADLAARMLLKLVAAKLDAPVARPQLDICVSHDMSLYLVRDRLLDLPVERAGDVKFLDAVMCFRRDGVLMVAAPDRAPRPLDLADRAPT
jgi:broad specificity phosphatase PhoE